MMLRKTLLLLISVLVPIIFVSTLYTQPAQAAGLGFPSSYVDDFSQGGVQELLVEFCNNRKGDVINLETWYAGKCNKGGNSFSGDAVGFGDITILYFLEILYGGQEKTSPEIIEELKNLLSQSTDLENKGIVTQSLALSKALNSVDDTKQGIVSASASFISFPLSHPPASAREYINHVANNMNKHKLVSDAYAQEGGYGFNRLQGVLPLWKGMRNISYSLFTLAFLVYGFMIMFRVKIDPRVTTTLQIALPKLIITLLLITFSYAIVGLMFDLMWLAYFIVLNAFDTFTAVNTKDIFNQVGSGQAGLFLGGLAHLLIAGTIGIPGALSAISAIPSSISVAAWWALLAVASVSGTIIVIIAIILALVILIAFGKLWFKLITAYVTIVINLIFSPLILLANIFPGSKAAGNWMRNIFANLVIFPITSILLLLSFVFMTQPLTQTLVTSSPDGAGGAGLAKVPVLFPVGLPGSDAMLAMIGLGLLLMSPKYVDIIKEALQIPPFKYGSAIGESLFLPTFQRTIGGGLQKGFQETYTEPAGRAVAGGIGSFLSGRGKKSGSSATKIARTSPAPGAGSALSPGGRSSEPPR